VTVSFDDLFVSTTLQVSITNLLAIPDSVPISPTALAAHVPLFDYSANLISQVTVDGQAISPVEDSYDGTLGATFWFAQVPEPGLEEISVAKFFGFNYLLTPSEQIAAELGTPFFPECWSNENFDCVFPSSDGGGSFSSEVIPEPTTTLLLAAGLAGIAAAGRRQR
jgi:hypothetical protein